MNRHPSSTLKNRVRGLLQAALGFDRYLELFALYRLVVSPLAPADRTFRAFLRLVPRELGAVDVGANVGATTLALARRCRWVQAFEPVPAHAKCIRRLAHLLRARNVDVHEQALGSTEGDVSMVLPELDGARLPGLARIAGPSDPGTRIAVRCSRLDSLASSFAGKVGAVKIDVEDSEADALHGAALLLARDRPIVLAELWHTPNRQRAMDLLSGLDYDAWVLGADGCFVRFDLERHPERLDFVFLPRASS